MPSPYEKVKLAQEYVGVPIEISNQARRVADELGIAASVVLREMIIAGKDEGLRRIRERAEEFAASTAA